MSALLCDGAGRLDPAEITERRAGRFFGSASEPDRGICAGYERIGDPLWDADAIARRLADQVPGGYGAVLDRFRFSVKAGGFGPPASRGRFASAKELHADQRSRAEATRNLIDLDSAVMRPPGPGRYALRPSVLIADELAPYMRARQSVWAHWIATQGWKVPPEFTAPMIEGVATNVTTALLPAPKANTGGRPRSVADQVELWFKALPEEQKRLGSAKLAKSYVADELPGNEDYVRKLITAKRR